MIKSKINDLDYCYATWQILIDLEKNTFARNEQIRAFQAQIRSKEAILLSVLALIPTILLWLLLFRPKIIVLIGNQSLLKVATYFLSLLMMSVFLYLICFLTLKFSLQLYPVSVLKAKLETSSRQQLILSIQLIDLASVKLLAEFKKERLRLPENFLSAELVEMLIRYFETDQVLTINEAIYSLKLELTNTGYYSRLGKQETLFVKVSDYLAQQDKLFESIRKGEI